MTEQNAQSWLSSHNFPIPAIEIHHRQALETLEDHAKTVSDLANFIALDPGMSMSLYDQVNGKLLQSGKTGVESVHTALSLLDNGAIAEVVMQHKVLDETFPDQKARQAYHQLISRTYHLLAQLDRFISIQGIHSIDEIRSAAVLHSIGEYMTCLYDHVRFRQYQANFHAMGSDAISAKAVFGFDFHELGRLLAKQMYLPALVTESLQENSSTGREARLIKLAAEVSRQAEEGWYHSEMKATEEVCAAYLNQSPDGFDKHLHQAAIESARSCPIDDVLPAAARLIMLPEREPIHATTIDAKHEVESAPNFEQRVKNLLDSPKLTQVQLIDLLMTHLQDDLLMTRVALLLLSADKSKLGTRAGKGIDEHSPIRTLVIDTTQASVLKSLLIKPQAVWINSASYRKFEAALPAKFKASFQHKNFFMMSLFIGGNPTGVVYCDRAQALNKLDKASYLKFKSAVMLISKALNHLAQRRRRQTV